MCTSTLARKLGLDRLGKDEAGFTLTELMVVVVIIGLLAAVATPIFLNQKKAAADAAVQSDVQSTVLNIQTYLTSNPTAQNLGTTADNTPPANTYKVTHSRDDIINVGRSQTSTAPNTTGYDGYSVSGYSPSGSKFSPTKVFLFDSLTGQFTSSAVTYGGVAASSTQVSTVRNGGPFTVTLASELPAGSGSITTSGPNNVTLGYSFNNNTTNTTAAATGATALQVRGDYYYLNYDITDCNAADGKNTLGPNGYINATDMKFYARDGSLLNVQASQQWLVQGNLQCDFSATKGNWTVGATFTNNAVTYNGSSDLSTLHPAYVTWIVGGTAYYMRYQF